MKKFYIVRHGWNSANQPSRGASARPQNTFESRLDQLVALDGETGGFDCGSLAQNITEVIQAQGFETDGYSLQNVENE